MTNLTPRQQRIAQNKEKLTRELGAKICAGLTDPDVIEIMANPNGELWFDRLSVGLQCTGVILSEAQIELAIGTVAAMHDLVVNDAHPRLKAEMPLDGSRFQGMIRPISAPMFVIRKHLTQAIPLTQHVIDETMTPRHLEVIRTAIQHRRNIILVGATLSGKTVIANSIIDEMLRVFGEQLRLVLIEDTYELVCPAANTVHLHTCAAADLRTLVQDTLRIRPDRIIVGEVRGAEALDLLKAWNTGHPGGVTTVHADTAAQALVRLETLIEEAGVRPNPRMIASAVHLIILMARVGSRQWRVQELIEVRGWDARTQQYRLQPLDGSALTYEDREIPLSIPVGSGTTGSSQWQEDNNSNNHIFSKGGAV